MKARILTLLLVISVMATAQNWHPISSGTVKDLNCIHFVDDMVGFIGGNDTLLLKTIDGGKTWTKQVVNIPFNVHDDIIDLWFENELLGYILTGPYGSLYETSDGGMSWNLDSINNSNMCFKRAIYFSDKDNGFIGGSMCFQGESIAKRENGTWDTVLTPGSWDANDQITNFDFYGQIGIATANSKYVYRTINNGQTWDSIPTGLDSVGLKDVVFVNDSTCYAAHPVKGFSGLMISNDAGLTWNPDINSLTFFYPGFNCITKDEYNRPYAGGFPSIGNNGFLLWKETNWWNYEVVDQPINDIEKSYDSIVFAVGDSGTIYSNVAPSTIGVEEAKIIDVDIYPNPSKEEITVKTNNTDWKKLDLITLNGSVLLTIESNSEILNIDLSAYPVGIYMLRLINENQNQSYRIIKI